MKLIKNAALLVAALFLSFNAIAQTTKDIVDVASGSKEHTTLVKAIKAAGLVPTLKGKGPFTVFAPTNTAFTKLPAGTLDNLLKPENKSALAGILTYHVVAGNLNAKAISAAITKGDGKAVLTTVAGGILTATVVKGKVVVTDEKGGQATVVTTDLAATNGVIHVIDKVLLPKD
jgi:uncharacterized surface protein with fasciclin (FAS1) repeats